MRIFQEYYINQNHSSLSSFLSDCPKDQSLIQVTTNSRLLTRTGRLELEQNLGMEPDSAVLMTLQQFDTEMQFEKHLKQFMEKCTDGHGRLLIIQTDASTEESLKLIECARYV